MLNVTLQSIFTKIRHKTVDKAPTPNIRVRVKQTQNSVAALQINDTKHRMGELTKLSKHLISITSNKSSQSINSTNVFIRHNPKAGLYTSPNQSLRDTLGLRDTGVAKTLIDAERLGFSKVGDKINLQKLEDKVNAYLRDEEASLAFLQQQIQPVAAHTPQPEVQEQPGAEDVKKDKPKPAIRTVSKDTPAPGTPIPKLRIDKQEVTSVMDAYIKQPSESIVPPTTVSSSAPAIAQKDDRATLKTKPSGNRVAEKVAIWEKAILYNTAPQNMSK